MTDGEVRAAADDGSRVLLALDTTPGALRQAAQDVFAAFVRFSGIPEEAGQATKLPRGEALSPASAARCITDYQRTAVFSRGVLGALRELAQRFPGERLQVLYAGCGPFAPLMLLPLLGWREAPAVFTLLDIHQESLDSARRLVAATGLEARLDACVCADATTYVPPGQVHLLIVETMQAGLRREPQVAVTGHLAPRLHPQGLLVPERIAVHAAVLESPVEGTWRLESLGRLCELTREPWTGGEPVRVAVPEGRRGTQLVLQTTIGVFGPHVLLTQDSGLTLPIVLRNLAPGEPGIAMEFEYREGPNPGFSWRASNRQQGARGSRSAD